MEVAAALLTVDFFLPSFFLKRRFPRWLAGRLLAAVMASVSFLQREQNFAPGSEKNERAPFENY